MPAITVNPESLWELSLGIYCTVWGFKRYFADPCTDRANDTPGCPLGTKEVRAPQPGRPRGNDTLGVRPERSSGARSPSYLTSVSSLNIGRYMLMMMMPTMMPTPTIIIGSMIEVSAWIEASTSSS